jgi:uncharacterized protein (TIGR00369 family)
LPNRKLSSGRLREFLSKMPFNSLVGIRLTRVHADGITIDCQVRRELLNGASVLHGGVAATLADAAVGLALHRHFGGLRPITTVELKISYFKPVSKGRVSARAHLLRVGSSICVGSVDLQNDSGQAIGTAIVTYMILPG